MRHQGPIPPQTATDQKTDEEPQKDRRTTGSPKNPRPAESRACSILGCLLTGKSRNPFLCRPLGFGGEHRVGGPAHSRRQAYQGGQFYSIFWQAGCHVLRRLAIFNSL